MHVPFDRGKDDLTARNRLVFLHVWFQKGDSSFHSFGTLKNFGDDQLVVVEEPSDFTHSRHQWTIDHLERPVTSIEADLKGFLEPLLGSVNDVTSKALIDREVEEW